MNGRVIQIPAGKKFSASELAAMVPEYGIVRLRREANGQLTPMLQSWRPEVRLTRDLPRQLGIEMDYQTLLRLTMAGFIASRRTAPRITLISVASLVQHMEDCRDPEFWNEARLARWKAVRDEGI